MGNVGRAGEHERAGPQQRPHALEHGPGVAQVLEHLAENQGVERLCGPRQLDLLDVAFHDLGEPLAGGSRRLGEELHSAVAATFPSARANAPVAPFEQPISRIDASGFSGRAAT